MAFRLSSACSISSRRPFSEAVTAPRRRSIKNPRNLEADALSNKIVSSDRSGHIILWSGTTFEKHHTIMNAHTDWIRHVDVSPCRKLIASVGDDSRLKIWHDGKVLLEKYHPGWPREIAFSPDNKYIAVAGQELKLYERTYTDRSVYPNVATTKSKSTHTSVRFVKDELVVTGGDTNNVNIYDLDLRLKRILKGHTSTIMCADVSPNSLYLVTGDVNGTIIRWNLKTGVKLAQITQPTQVKALKFHPKKRIVACIGSFGLVGIWDLKRNSLSFDMTDTKRVVHAVDFSPCGRFVAIGLDYSQITIRSIANGEVVTVLDGHLGDVLSVCWS